MNTGGSYTNSNFKSLGVASRCEHVFENTNNLPEIRTSQNDSVQKDMIPKSDDKNKLIMCNDKINGKKENPRRFLSYVIEKDTLAEMLQGISSTKQKETFAKVISKYIR